MKYSADFEVFLKYPISKEKKNTGKVKLPKIDSEPLISESKII